MLKRTSNSSDPQTGGTTVNYWLGLNKIAEEKWVDAAADQPVFRPDPETAATPQDAGWYIFRAPAGGGSMAYVTDAARGKVLHLSSGSAAANSGVFLLGDSYSGNDNPSTNLIGGSSFNQADKQHVGLWVKNADPAHAPFRVGVLGGTPEDGEVNVNYVTDSGTDSQSGGCYTAHLGNASDTDFNDGAWHYLELDLNHAAVCPDCIEGIVIKGASVYVDDIVISGAALGRTYQLVPNVTIGGCLGTWGINWQNQESRWFYQYNDLGTVMATTNKEGHATAICEPDHFGNYQYMSGTRPDTMGITGKFYDFDIGLYDFGFRWLDHERSTWESKEPLGYYESINLYSFSKCNPIYYYDPNGKNVYAPMPIGPQPVWRPDEKQKKYGNDLESCRNTCLQLGTEVRRDRKIEGVGFACGSHAALVATCMKKCMEDRGYCCEARKKEGFISLPIGFFHAVAQIRCDGSLYWETIDNLEYPIIPWGYEYY